MKARAHQVDPGPIASTAPDDAVPILIVDDNAGKRVALKAMLSPLGHHIVEADSGLSALRHLISQDFAVILMDVRMPVMDGFETAHFIRQRQQSELTPIIFITAYAGEAMANITAYATGAADFIFSPVPSAELRAKVTVFANLYLRAQLLVAQAREVQASADQLAVLTDSAPIGIYRTDAENNYVYTNPRWSEITGIPFAEAVERPWDIITPEHIDLMSTATSAGDGGDRLSRRFELCARDESVARVVEWTATLLVDADGTVLGWVGTLSDVTAQAAVSATMEAARDSALTAARMQRDLAATASHELKTPTASVIGFVEEVLDNNDLSDVDREHLDIAYRSAQRLGRLIDDLLVLSKEDLASDKGHCVPTELLPLLELSVSSFSGTAMHSSVQLTIDPAGEHPTGGPCALADPPRLEQALNNLISNALKFTPPGGEIRVGVRSTQDTVLIDVSDSGVGIEPSAIEDIFHRFYRTQDAIDTGVTGSGLGLAIAQRMIEAQHGRLSVESVLGQGSTFTITLPTASHPAQ